MKVNIKHLMDDAQCYDTVRELRWPEARFVIPNVSSGEALTIRNPQDNAMNAKIATNALMT